MAYQNAGEVTPEHQCIDWKEKRDDEFLKWICGFANGQDGRLEIGRNNNGVVVGLPNFKKLLDDLPNKIKSTMGILPAVNLCYEDGKEYIVMTCRLIPTPSATEADIISVRAASIWSSRATRWTSSCFGHTGALGTPRRSSE